MKEFSRTLSRAQGRVPSSSVLLKPKVCPLSLSLCFCFVSPLSILPFRPWNKRLAALYDHVLKTKRLLFKRFSRVKLCERCESLHFKHGFAFQTSSIIHSKSGYIFPFLFTFLAILTIYGLKKTCTFQNTKEHILP